MPVIPREEEPEPVIPEPTLPVKSCPSTCDDSDSCTSDYCNSGTDYECRHDLMYSCCGNGICEDEESYRDCLSDCTAPAAEEDEMFSGKSVFEKIEMIADIGKSDKEKAIGYCNEIEQTGYRYDCFGKVAISSGDDDVCLNVGDSSYKDTCYKEFATTKRESEVCSEITKDSKRDQCYMDFATKEDYTVCDKLVNKYLKQSCDSLKKLSEVKVPSQ